MITLQNCFIYTHWWLFRFIETSPYISSYSPARLGCFWWIQIWNLLLQNRFLEIACTHWTMQMMQQKKKKKFLTIPLKYTLLSILSNYSWKRHWIFKMFTNLKIQYSNVHVFLPSEPQNINIFPWHLLVLCALADFSLIIWLQCLLCFKHIVILCNKGNMVKECFSHILFNAWEQTWPVLIYSFWNWKKYKSIQPS